MGRSPACSLSVCQHCSWVVAEGLADADGCEQVPVLVKWLGQVVGEPEGGGAYFAVVVVEERDQQVLIGAYRPVCSVGSAGVFGEFVDQLGEERCDPLACCGVLECGTQERFGSRRAAV